MDHSQGKAGGHGGIHRVASCLHHLYTRTGRQLVHAGHHGVRRMHGVHGRGHGNTRQHGGEQCDQWLRVESHPYWNWGQALEASRPNEGESNAIEALSD